MKARYFEYMEEDLTYKSSSLLGIKGSLKRNITFWENIGASAFILDIISYGFKGALAIRRIFSLVDMITKPKFSNSPNIFKIGLFR